MGIDNGYKISVIDNKIRVISEEMSNVKSVTFGIWVKVGSRSEDDATFGASHFIEHMLFKGTKTRSAKDIAEEIDAMGANLNAYTSKEYTCFYVRTLDENFEQSVDVLTDMFLNSKFDKDDIDKEREVIVEEIKMYEDIPDEYANDLFSESFWNNHQLGKPILGTEDSLKKLGSSELQAYMDKYYTGENIVIAAAGNIKHEQVLKIAKKYFAQIKQGVKNKINTFSNYQTNIQCVQKDIGQVQICMGVPSVKANDKDLYKVALLNSCLGGSMSSRLMQKIREEMGMAYSIFSYYTAYEDCGILAINVATRGENCQKVVDEIILQTKALAKDGIEEWELERVKGQFKASSYLSMESSQNRMNRLGRGLLLLDKVTSVEDKISEIQKVSCDDIKQMAQDMFAENKWVITVLGMVDDVKINF